MKLIVCAYHVLLDLKVTSGKGVFQAMLCQGGCPKPSASELDLDALGIVVQLPQSSPDSQTCNVIQFA